MKNMIILISFLTALADTASAASVSNGETLAKRWCAACHVVASDQKTAGTEAPPFSSIAEEPRFNAARLSFFLMLPHPRMPDMSLTRSETEDLAAYIKSQGNHQK